MEAFWSTTQVKRLFCTIMNFSFALCAESLVWTVVVMYVTCEVRPRYRVQASL